MAHTTLSIDKETYQKTAQRAKNQHISVSSVARMLLSAYAEGRINIMAIQADEPIEFRELSEEEITPAIRKAANKARKMSRNQLINIPV